MVRRFFEEAAALASITLFLATIAVWIQVLGVIWFPYPGAAPPGASARPRQCGCGWYGLFGRSHRQRGAGCSMVALGRIAVRTP